MVIVRLTTHESYALDRGLTVDRVALQIMAGRGSGKLLPFQDNATPSKTIYIDPDHVVAIRDDGRAY